MSTINRLLCIFVRFQLLQEGIFCEKRTINIYIFTVVLFTVLLVLGNRIAMTGEAVQNVGATTVSEELKVVNIIDDAYEETLYADYPDARSESIVLFEGEFTKGYKKGTTTTAVQRVDALYAVEIEQVEIGDKVVAYRNPDPSIPADYMFAEYNRVPVLFVLMALFCLLILFFGKSKGFNAIISLVLTLASIFWVLLPAILRHKNVYFWSILVCIYTIFMTLLIVSGWTRKSLAAIIGCTSGVLACGVIVLISDLFLNVTGLVDEDALYLLMLDSENPISIKAVVFAAIIIGAVGAVMDVAMDIASALAEIKAQAPDISAAQIVKSGFSIGHDIIGTMTNTLILAYIGSSLSITLLMVAGNPSMLYLLNTEMIVVELLQAIAGSFGMLLTIPLTSLVCGILYSTKSKNKTMYKNDAE